MRWLTRDQALHSHRRLFSSEEARAMERARATRRQDAKQGLESWPVTMDDVRLHLCKYKQLILTKGSGAKSEGGIGKDEDSH